MPSVPVCILALYVGFGKGRVLREYLGAVFGSMCSFVSLIAASSLDLLQLCVCVCYVLSNSNLLLCCFSDQVLGFVKEMLHLSVSNNQVYSSALIMQVYEALK